jgi:hypothetical protein
MTKPEENTIDILMDLGEPPYPDKAIEAIIAYHRKNRANAEAGIKPPKAKGSVSLDAVRAALVKAPSTPAVKRRV